MWAVFMVMGCGSSGSLFPPSSLSGTREAGAGDELCTTMAGVLGVEDDSGFLPCVRMESRRELRRDRERVSGFGGGLFRRGETGQWGVLSPEVLFPDADLSGRAALGVSCCCCP